MIKIRLAKTDEWVFIKKNADEIYFKNEKEFWKSNYFRISKEDCISAINNRELFVLSNGSEIFGFVIIKKLNAESLTFSMLTVIEKHQKKGYGQKMLDFIFKKSKKENITQIFLEILCAKNWNHPQKEFLIRWYSDYGFTYNKSYSFEKLYPTHKKYMNCELIFKQYVKKIMPLKIYSEIAIL